MSDYQYKVGDKGKTRGGYDYRVICTDAAGHYPLISLYMIGGEQFIGTHQSNGRWRSQDEEDHRDLIPPIRTVVFWVNVYARNGRLSCGIHYNTEENADAAAGAWRIGPARRIELEV